MASRIASRGASTRSICLLRMNRNLSTVSISEGSLRMIVSRPSPSERGRTAFSRATDSGTSSMTDGRDGDFGDIDVGQTVLLRNRPGNVFTGHVAQADQGVGKFDARLLGHLLGLGDLVRADKSRPMRISVYSAFFLAIGDSGLPKGRV